MKGYQEEFPKILEKTYPNMKDVSTPNIPQVLEKSWISEDRIISLPFIDTVNLKRIEAKDLPKDSSIPIEIKLSEINPNLETIRKKLLKEKFKEEISRGHIVSNLTTEEDFWKRFHKHTRNEIRKAKENGANVKEMNSVEQLKKFFGLYSKEMRTFGTPQQSFKFFKNAYSYMKGNFKGFNCYKENELLGGIILFLENDYCYVSFNVSSKNGKKHKTNDLLYWESIKWCMEKGIKYFDVGQVDLNPEKGTREDSLLKFKKKWLGKEYKRIYFRRNFSSSENKKSSLKKFRKIWKRLPLSITKIMGPRIISQIGQ